MDKTNNNTNNNNDLVVMTKKIPSEKLVSTILQNGCYDIIINTSIGLCIGTLFGIVLSRGGSIGGSTVRKCLGGFGSGIGFGSTWTHTSITLEDLLKVPVTTPAATTATTEQKQPSETTTQLQQQSTIPKMSS